jgi:hypothetical protein
MIVIFAVLREQVRRKVIRRLEFKLPPRRFLVYVVVRSGVECVSDVPVDVRCEDAEAAVQGIRERKVHRALDVERLKLPMVTWP